MRGTRTSAFTAADGNASGRGYPAAAGCAVLLALCAADPASGGQQEDVQQILDEDLDEEVLEEELEDGEPPEVPSGEEEPAQVEAGVGAKGAGKAVLGPAGEVDWDQSFLDEAEGPLLVTTPTRRPEKPFYTSSAVDLVDAAGIAEAQAVTTDSALLDLPGVSVVQVTSAGGGPVLRGLLGQRVALMVDGIPLHHPAVWPGPSLLASSVDPTSLAGIEVVRGASQVLSGPQAVGGVVNFVPELPVINPLVSYRAEASAFFRYGSADTSQVLHADLDFQLRDAAATFDFTLGNFGALLDGAGKQALTGYEASAFSLGVRKRIAAGHGLLFHYGARGLRQLHQPLSGTSEFMRWPSIDRHLIYLRYSGEDVGPFVDLRATVGMQLFDEKPQYNSSLVDTGDPYSIWHKQEVESSTFFAQLWGRAHLGGWSDLLVGADYAYSFVETEGHVKHIRGSEAEILPLPRTVLPDGARSHRLEPHVLMELYALSPLLLSVGGRLWYHDLAPGGGLSDRHLVGGAVEVSGRYPLTDLMAFVMSVGYGSRPPTLTELAGQACGPVARIPAPGLEPEGAVSAEVGTRWNLGILEGSLFYGFTLLHDAIVEVEATGSAIPQCPGHVPLVMQNTDLAWMNAIELRNHVNVGQAWRIGTILSWQRGTVRMGEDGTQPMSDVPPLMGTAFLTVRYPRQYLWGDVRLRFSLAQERHPEDEPLASFEDDPFFLLSVRGGLDLGSHLRLFVAFENLLDQVHRYHGSYLDGPGRSVYLGVEGHL